jgi:hypothetical protein
MKELTEEQVTKHVVFTTSVHYKLCDELTRKNRKLTKSVTITDMKDYSMFDFDKKFIRGLIFIFIIFILFIFFCILFFIFFLFFLFFYFIFYFIFYFFSAMGESSRTAEHLFPQFLDKTIIVNPGTLFRGKIY